MILSTYLNNAVLSESRSYSVEEAVADNIVIIEDNLNIVIIENNLEVITIDLT